MIFELYVQILSSLFAIVNIYFKSQEVRLNIESPVLMPYSFLIKI